MANEPAINTDAPFPHREAVLAALRQGGTCRADDRELRADQLLGTYLIRLNIALDPELNGGIPDEENTLGHDLSYLTERLRVVGTARVQAFYVHAPEGVAYHVFQVSEDAASLGCIRGEPPRGDL